MRPTPSCTTRQQYITRAQWRTHIEKHCRVERLQQNAHLPTRCTEAFESSVELDYHLQDVHCWISRDSARPRGVLKRTRPEDEGRPRERKRWKVPCGSYLFMNENVKFGESYLTPTSTSSLTPGFFSDPSSPASLTSSTSSIDIDTPEISEACCSSSPISLTSCNETDNFGESYFTWLDSYHDPDNQLFSHELSSPPSLTSSTSSMVICPPETSDASSSNSPTSSAFYTPFHTPGWRAHYKGSGALDPEFNEELKQFGWVPKLDMQFDAQKIRSVGGQRGRR